MRKKSQQRYLLQRGGAKIFALLFVLLLLASGLTWAVFRELERQLQIQNLSEYLAEIVLTEAINSISIVNEEQVRTRLLADTDVIKLLVTETDSGGKDIGICLNRLACAAHLSIFTGCYLPNGNDQGTFTCTETLACTNGGTRAALVKILASSDISWLRPFLTMLGLFDSASSGIGFTQLQGTLYMTGPTKSRISYSNCD